MINSKFVLTSVFSGLMMFTSCSRDVIGEPIIEQSFRTSSAKEISMEKFANVLSKATYEREDIKRLFEKRSRG